MAMNSTRSRCRLLSSASCWGRLWRGLAFQPHLRKEKRRSCSWSLWRWQPLTLYRRRILCSIRSSKSSLPRFELLSLHPWVRILGRWRRLWCLDSICKAENSSHQRSRQWETLWRRWFRLCSKLARYHTADMLFPNSNLGHFKKHTISLWWASFSMIVFFVYVQRTYVASTTMSSWPNLHCRD